LPCAPPPPPSWASLSQTWITYDQALEANPLLALDGASVYI
jgi:hypothetical protein